MTRVDAVLRRAGAAGSAPPLLIFLFLATTCDSRAVAADGPNACGSPVAHVVSIQGSIELRRAGQNTWAKVSRLDTPVCEGDRLRTGALSRTALFIQPETLVRVDQNTSISVSQTKEETLVEFTQEEVVTVSITPHTCGAGYFITRFPRKFKVNTPHLNAAVEGTEFLVALRCESTELSVFEGKVLAEGGGAYTFDAQSISSGQTLSIGGVEPPAIKLLVKPADAVQWTLYYPPISPAGAAPAEDCRLVATDERVPCLIARAEQLLRSGRVEEAQAHISDALAAAPYSSDAMALSSIISLVRNDKAEALRLAKEAITANSLSAPAWLAQSYAQQADFKLNAALVSARRASELTPTSALAFARVAELQLSLGRIREAEKTAKQAVEANPSESRAHMILGFVHLAQINVKEAHEDFGRAIENDSTDPISRLGLGLAIIREGKLVEGRQQIEIAVALDPTNSLIRSYVGKAYFEENSKERDTLTATQFELAKKLDPKDPTPYFYAALLDQSLNKPVGALAQLRGSIDRNESRAVYRSRLLLDGDAASKAASAANLYGKLGFEQLSIVTSTNAIEEDPNNHAAHQLLAIAYTNLPRHDIARVSESLQAQIRRPLAAYPADPLINSDNLGVMVDTGATRPGTYEYTSLFNRDRPLVQFDAIAASRNTVGNQLSIGGLSGRIAATLSQFHYHTDGFIDNDSVQKDIHALLVHGQISSHTSLQLDLKHADFEIGETLFRFDPGFSIPATIAEESNTARLNGHHMISANSEWVWTAALEDRFRVVDSFPDGGLITDTDASANTVEIQHIGRWNQFRLVSGFVYIDDDRDFIFEQLQVRSSSTNGYLYGQWATAVNQLRVHVGVTLERYERTLSVTPNTVTRSKPSPKLGLTWKPSWGTTVRLASFTAVRRPFIGSQTLEPTQIAGFNQYFTGLELLYGDVEGTISRRNGIAIDQAFSETTFAGFEWARRDLEVPIINRNRDYDWREATLRGYLYKALPRLGREGVFTNWQVAFTLESEHEKLERPQQSTGSEGIIRLVTSRAPAFVRLFHESGVSVKVGATYVKQSGIFSLDEGFDIVQKEDHAWIYDALVEYKLPRRKGTLMLGVRNLTDNFVDLVETDPLNPRVAIRRFGFLAFKVAF
jgi:tetratricopeptide (TPR) repeat protein